MFAFDPGSIECKGNQCSVFGKKGISLFGNKDSVQSLIFHKKLFTQRVWISVKNSGGNKFMDWEKGGQN